MITEIGLAGSPHANNSVGFTLYMDMLHRAVDALKRGEIPNVDAPLDQGTEVNLHTPALIPDDYLPDVNSRLILYKRIAAAANDGELRDLQVEMIDRFGLLPQPAKNLFAVTGLKLKVQPLGIKRIEAGPKGGRILFDAEPGIDPAHLIKLIQTRPKEFKLDGGDKLRFIRDLANPQSRIDQVQRVLHVLTGG